MTQEEIKYAAEQHLAGKPMPLIAAELHYHENTLWRNLRQSNLEYKKRLGVHQVKSFGRTEDYIRGYNAGLKAAWRKRKREEQNV